MRKRKKKDREKKLKLNTLPKGPGVYLFKDPERPLYIGKSTNVYERVKSHLSSDGEKARKIIKQAKRVEAIPVGYELEALLLEAALIKKHAPPYNSRAKDDKHPLYIKITTGEEFPVVTTSRREEKENAVYFGPFPSSSTVREVLRQLRKIFPFHSQKRGKISKKACFHSHLGLCNPCPAQILKVEDEKKRKSLKRQYRQNIKNLAELLSGKAEGLKKRFERKMKQAAKREDFEKAASYRDQLQRLEYITTPYQPTTSYLENPRLLEDIREGEERELLKLLRRHLPVKRVKRIECFDVSHLRGELSAASMVTFVNGEPEKNFYRHFRIRRDKKGDDFAMMKEVIERRLKHLDDWGKPDLLVVDGGKPQISAAYTIIKEKGVEVPLLGLAKRHEHIYVFKEDEFETKNFKRIKLPKNSPALQLIQRLRDEAHRFARSYHLKLRLKSLHNGL